MNERAHTGEFEMRSPIRLILFVSLLFAWVPLVAAEDIQFHYSGELITAEALPLAGVFNLTFKIYEDADEDEDVWNETHFIASIEGQYTVVLGSVSQFSDELLENEPYIAVEFGGQELYRERLGVSEIQHELEVLAEETTGDPNHDYEITALTFAQLADQAFLADEALYARDCQRLGGRTFEEFDQFDALLNSLDDHLADPEAHSTGRSGGPIGSSQTVLPRIGGDGGARYTRMCPEGHVVVGLRGGAAMLVDSFEVICAPIE